MDSVIYLEPDEEITSVIEKLKRSKSPIVGIVAPRNAVLLQSVVNLKLLKRQALALKKEIALVTADKIGQNLSLRTGLTVFANVHDTEPLPPLEGAKPENFIEDESAPQPPTFTGGFQVHRYDEHDIVDSQEGDESATDFTSRTVNPLDKNSIIPDESEEDTKEPELEKLNNVPESIKELKNQQDDNIIEAKGPDKKPVNAGLKTSKVKVNYTKIITVLAFPLVIICLIAYLALGTVSKAAITINVSATPISEELKVTVSKDTTTVNLAKNIIPGRLLESPMQDTQTFKATGKKNVGENATGKMTVSNEGVVSQSLEAKTAFKGTGGLIFRSNKAFTVPAASAALDSHGNPYKINGTVTIDVTADKPGEDYNISAASYTVPGFALLSGQGTAMTGGLTKEITVVSQEDIDKATAFITKDLYAKSLVDLKKKSADAVILENAVKNETIDTTNDTEVGSQVDEFSLTIKTKSSVLVFDKEKMNDIINQVLQSKKPENKALLAADTKNLKFQVITSNPQAGTMQISTTAKGSIIPKLDKNAIAADLVGKNRQQIDEYFDNQSDINNINVKFTPTWWLKRVPRSSGKTTITIRTQDK